MRLSFCLKFYKSVGSNKICMTCSHRPTRNITCLICSVITKFNTCWIKIIIFRTTWIISTERILVKTGTVIISHFLSGPCSGISVITFPKMHIYITTARIILTSNCNIPWTGILRKRTTSWNLFIKLIIRVGITIIPALTRTIICTYFTIWKVIEQFNGGGFQLAVVSIRFWAGSISICLTVQAGFNTAFGGCGRYCPPLSYISGSSLDFCAKIPPHKSLLKCESEYQKRQKSTEYTHSGGMHRMIYVSFHNVPLLLRLITEVAYPYI